MKETIHYLSLAAAAAAAFLMPCACGLVNIEDVDNINTEVTVAPGTEVTVMSEYSKTLGELLTSSTDGVLTVTAEGNYAISYQIVKDQSLGDGFTFDASQFAITLSDSYHTSINLSEASIPANTPIEYNPADKDAVAALFPDVNIDFFESLLSQNYAFNFDLDCSISNFPELIKSIQKADLDGSISFTLRPSGIPFQKFVFKKGTSISFPSFFVFSSCSNTDFDLSGGNVLTANKDVNVPMNTGVSFTLALKSLDFGNGLATKGSLPLSGKVAMDGTISISPSDFTGETTSINLSDYPILAPYLGSGSHNIVVVKANTALSTFAVDCDYAANSVSIKNATIQLSKDAIPTFDAGNYSVAIKDKLPKELVDGNPQIELSDVQVNMSLNSTLPFSFGLNANLVTLNGTSVVRNYELGPLDFAANSTTSYSLGTHANGEAGGVIYKEIKDLGKLLNPVPEKVEVKDFEVLFNDSQWLTVESGKNYGGTLSADIQAPLSFTADTKLSLSLAMDDMQVNLNQVNGLIKGDTRAIVKFSYENQIPLNFDMTMVVKDEDKNVMSGVAPKDPVKVAAATKNGAAKGDVNIELTIPSGGKMVKSIGFTVTASAQDPDLCLSPNQKISIKNITFCLPDGVTTDLKDLVK